MSNLQSFKVMMIVGMGPTTKVWNGTAPYR